jgi:hypothetical protein
MNLGSFAGLVFLEGAAVGIAFATRTRRFIPRSALRGFACIAVGLFVVAPLGSAIWRMAGELLGPADALLFVHLPFLALTFALLALGVRSVLRPGRATG